MSEVRQLEFIVLDYHEDRLKDIGYLKILTKSQVEWIKLPTAKRKYKYQHQLSSLLVATGEAVKTRKNWVLTKIHQTQPLLELQDYNQYLQYAEYIKVLNSQLLENQQTSVLQTIQEFFSSVNYSNQTFLAKLKDLQEQTRLSLGFIEE
jgi:predicted glycosyltransferase